MCNQRARLWASCNGETHDLVAWGRGGRLWWGILCCRSSGTAALVWGPCRDRALPLNRDKNTPIHPPERPETCQQFLSPKLVILAGVRAGLVSLFAKLQVMLFDSHLSFKNVACKEKLERPSCSQGKEKQTLFPCKQISWVGCFFFLKAFESAALGLNAFDVPPCGHHHAVTTTAAEEGQQLQDGAVAGGDGL